MRIIDGGTSRISSRISASCVLQIIVAWLICCFLVETAQADETFKERIEMLCGLHRIAITCGKLKPGEIQSDIDTRICVHNILSFSDVDGKVLVPREPKNVISLGEKGNSPKMMGCGKGKDGLFYVEVMFSGCPGGSCEMYDLFSEDGERLTVNGNGLGKITKEKAIKFPERSWLLIEGIGSSY